MTMRHVMTAMLATALLTGCNRGATPAAETEAELPTLDVTSWTEKTELFMEHPPLVGGETIRFAVHLTKMADFSAPSSRCRSKQP